MIQLDDTLSDRARRHAELAFLDGYLLRVVLEALEAHGADDAGLYGYYETRARQQRRMLSVYDLALLDYIAATFDKKRYRILHAGIGIGTLIAALAFAGFATAGVERDPRRFAAANRLRAALSGISARAPDQIELIYGEFPEAIRETTWQGKSVLLVFTNCVAGWNEDLLDQVISRFRKYGNVLLDTRLFGKVRESDAERAELIQRIEARGFSATPIPHNPTGCFYCHVRRFTTEPVVTGVGPNSESS